MEVPIIGLFDLSGKNIWTFDLNINNRAGTDFAMGTFFMVTTATAVPEPTTILLLGTGLVGQEETQAVIGPVPKL